MDLSSFAKKSEIPRVDLSDYAKKSEIPKVDLSRHALKSEIPQIDLSPFAKKSDIPRLDLSDYAKKSEIPKMDLSSFAKKSEIPRMDLSSFAKKSEIPKVDLSRHALKSEIPKMDLSSFAKKNEIPKVNLSDYVERAEISKLTGQISDQNDNIRGLKEYIEKLELRLNQMSVKSAPVKKKKHNPKEKLTEYLSIKNIKADKSIKDDLKKVKGVGPFIEKKLNSLGIYTYNQIGSLNADDIELITDTIEFFPGRIERDGWVKQASALHQSHHLN